MIYGPIQKRCYSVLSVKDLVLVAGELLATYVPSRCQKFYDITNCSGETHKEPLNFGTH